MKETKLNASIVQLIYAKLLSEFRSKKWNLAWRIESTRPVYSLPPVSDYIPEVTY